MKARGARLDAAARGPERRSAKRAASDGAGAAKPLGSVWLVASSYSLAAAGLKNILEGQADVRVVGDASVTGSPSCLVLYADDAEGGLLDGIRRVRGLYPGVPLLVFGPRLDLALAHAVLKGGADGFVHAAMAPEQVLRAVEVVQKGELASPRQLLGHLLSQEGKPKLGDLSARQREILQLVGEGLSNAEIARRLRLAESTIKQHLRAAYKVLGVKNRTEAAKAMKNGAEAL